jgi:hypothetical protein
MNAEPFYAPNAIQFRREMSSFLSPDHAQFKNLKAKFPTTMIYETCSASEMNTLCSDMLHAGYGKAVIVPTVRFAYDSATYDRLQAELPYRTGRFVPVVFQPLSETVQCLPMERDHLREPDGILGEVLA